LCDSKVRNLDQGDAVRAGVEQDVVGLDVAVNDRPGRTHRVRSLDASAELVENRAHLVEVRLHVALGVLVEPRPQRDPVDELRDDEQPIAHHAAIHHRDDVGVHRLSERVGLAAEPLHDFGVAKEIGVKEFDGDVPTGQPSVLGAPHFAERTLAQQINQLVAAIDDHPGSEWGRRHDPVGGDATATPPACLR
jgi:hypothetical protein